jgi:coatomer protein complex subunit epsilon
VPVALQSVKLFASYLANPAQKDRALLTLEDWLADAAVNNNPTLQLVAGSVYLHEGQFGPALKAVKAAATLEQAAICVQIYLKLDRPDLAEKQVRACAHAHSPDTRS